MVPSPQENSHNTLSPGCWDYRCVLSLPALGVYLWCLHMCVLSGLCILPIRGIVIRAVSSKARTSVLQITSPLLRKLGVSMCGLWVLKEESAPVLLQSSAQHLIIIPVSSIYGTVSGFQGLAFFCQSHLKSFSLDPFLYSPIRTTGQSPGLPGNPFVVFSFFLECPLLSAAHLPSTRPSPSLIPFIAPSTKSVLLI